MKILVTGSAGMLGSTLCPILTQRGQEVIATDFAQIHDGIHLDVTDYTQVDEIVGKTRPDIVMHLAAETDVDKCEREPDHAFLMNTIGTQNVAYVCQKRNVTMAYISTTGVFYGDKFEPYTEFDPPNPINVYGRSKLEVKRSFKVFSNGTTSLGRLDVWRWPNKGQKIHWQNNKTNE